MDSPRIVMQCSARQEPRCDLLASTALSIPGEHSGKRTGLFQVLHIRWNRRPSIPGLVRSTGQCYLLCCFAHSHVHINMML